MPFLRYTTLAGGIKFAPLDKDVTSLGRSKECDVVLDDGNASRRHCELRRGPNGWILVDLNSKNGTFVNGSAVASWSLSDGDLISIGNQQLLYKLQR
jgi:pSer/pThr/pTyr-binding forkhead associated (FHA) protein